MAPLQYKFDQVLKFPCNQQLRIIVTKEEGSDQRLVDAITAILPGATTIDHIMNSRPSANGNYISYNISVRFNDARSIEMLYAKLSKHSFVKHIL